MVFVPSCTCVADDSIDRQRRGQARRRFVMSWLGVLDSKINLLRLSHRPRQIDPGEDVGGDTHWQ
ncbi:unnamed protein product [Brassica oleracea]